MKKCKEGHYYCYKDSKCKPIPKGYRRGVGGYLRREREDEQEDSKKNGNGKSNGSSNGNGNGGNGSGNGNGSSGGNGGGNGSGGIGENVEIQNSDGQTTAIVVDIIGPAHMKPMVNNSGVWKGTEISERKMTENEKEKKEDIVKGMKKDKKGFKKRYGKDAKSVMYATATKLAMEEKHKDHEPEMIRSQLKTAKRASKKIKKHTLKKDNFKAWVQSKITKASDYLDTAADYLDSKDDVKEELDKKDKPYIKKLVKNLRKGSKTHAKQADKLEKAINEDALDENLRPLVKGASYLMRKLAKKSKTFNNLAKKGLADTTIKMPNIKKSDLSQYAMYHGTAKKSADKIMKSGFKKSKDSVMNPDRSVIKKKNRAFATTDPEVAKVYADMAAKRTGGKPEILAVKVRAVSYTHLTLPTNREV